jgi:hypothetical protein
VTYRLHTSAAVAFTQPAANASISQLGTCRRLKTESGEWRASIRKI